MCICMRMHMRMCIMYMCMCMCMCMCTCMHLLDHALDPLERLCLCLAGDHPLTLLAALAAGADVELKSVPPVLRGVCVGQGEPLQQRDLGRSARRGGRLVEGDCAMVEFHISIARGFARLGACGDAPHSGGTHVWGTMRVPHLPALARLAPQKALLHDSGCAVGRRRELEGGEWYTGCRLLLLRPRGQTYRCHAWLKRATGATECSPHARHNLGTQFSVERILGSTSPRGGVRNFLTPKPLSSSRVLHRPNKDHSIRGPHLKNSRATGKMVSVLSRAASTSKALAQACFEAVRSDRRSDLRPPPLGPYETLYKLYCKLRLSD